MASEQDTLEKAPAWVPARWIPALEPLRGLAALAVVIHHIFQLFYKDYGGRFPTFFAWLGFWGVGLFFVLSGFCIHLPHARRFAENGGSGYHPDWGAFLRQRARRLLPAYFVTLFVCSVLGLYVTSDLISRPTTRGILAHVFFVHGFVVDEFHTINSVLWSIGVEVHFYLLYPIFLFLRRRLGGGPTVLFLFVEGLVAYYLFGKCDPEYRNVWYGSFFVQWWIWALGAWMADIYVSRAPPRWIVALLTFPGAYGVWITASLAVSYADFVFLRVHWNRYAGYLLFALTIGAAVVRKGAEKSPLRILAPVGDWSYSLYLMHPVVLCILPSLIHAWPVMLQRVALIAASLLLAKVMFELVEEEDDTTSLEAGGGVLAHTRRRVLTGARDEHQL